MCYTAVGWTTDVDYFVNSPAESNYEDLTFSHLAMAKTDNRRGHVFFTSVDRVKKDVRRFGWRAGLGNMKDMFSGIWDQLSGTVGTRREALIEFPITTIQAYSEKRGDYSEEQIEELRQFFVTARDTLLDSPRWNSQQSSDGP